MIRTLVAFSAVVCLCFGDVEPPDIKPCIHNDVVYDLGQRFVDGCDRCMCGLSDDYRKGNYGPDYPSSAVRCWKNPSCCLYTTETGESKRADRGDSWYTADRCERCTCGRYGEVHCGKTGWCYAKPCPNSRGEIIEDGEGYVQGCEYCRCNDGKVECSENTVCCPYTTNPVAWFAATQRAFPGNSFSDGCNRCTCGNNGEAFCTLRGCPNKCSYRSWPDQVHGYLSVGETVIARVEGSDCPKKCTCTLPEGGHSAVLGCADRCAMFL